MSLAVSVFVIESLPCLDHWKDLLKSLDLGFFALGVGDVVGKFALLALGELAKTGMRLLVPLQRLL